MRSPALTGLLATAVALVLGSAAPVALAACPNESARTGLSANLPDCRAYEQVSPQEKDGYDVQFYAGRRSSPSGEAFQFESNGSFAGTAGSAHTNDYVARRGAGGWSTQGLTPLQEPNGLASLIAVYGFVQFTPDLTSGVFMNTNPPALGASGNDAHSLYLQANGNTYQLLTPAPPNPSPFYQPTFAGASTDLSHVFFASSAALTPDAPAGQANLYEWTNGQVNLVGILPNGAPAPAGASAVFGASSNTPSADTYSSVSQDGSQVVFASGSPSQLYMRTNANTTVAISNSAKTGSVGEPAPSGVTFMGTASGDGHTISKVFFASEDELTNDANTGHGEETIYGHGTDLYEYDVASGGLRDVTVDTSAEDSEGARVVSSWFAPSTDGSYIYFDAEGVLAPGGHFNEDNLYLLHNGTTSYVGPVQGYDIGSIVISKDGRRLIYQTTIPETADNNGGLNQMYLYDAPSDTWTCTSCLPGITATAGTSTAGFLTGYGSFARYQPRNLTDDGQRVFFQTEAALVPQDTNGQSDVYEWENGTIQLISSGQGANGADFMDASADGDDVFFTTREQLLPSDTDANVDVYDARVDGGTARQPSPPACTGTGCQGVPGAPPIFATPPSVTFNGVGNFAPAAKPTAKKQPKVKKKPKHKTRAKSKPKHNAKSKAKSKAKRKGAKKARQGTTSSQRSIKRAGR
jgi:hypothetical protein